jgi:hypothetical protein
METTETRPVPVPTGARTAPGGTRSSVKRTPMRDETNRGSPTPSGQGVLVNSPSYTSWM